VIGHGGKRNFFISWQEHRGSWVTDLFFVSLGVALLLGPHLGRRALWEPDEGRYAEIPREMLATGDFVTPRLNGVKYFEKPPLFYWLEAATMRALGPAEWALRLPPALFALGGCLAVYAAGRRLFGRRAGLLAAAVLATSPLYFAIGQIVILDMAVSVELTAAFLAFLLAGREPPGRRLDLLIWIFWAAAALAVLTKGLIGIVLPGLIIGAWTLLFRRWEITRRIFQPSGVALFLLIAVPWHVLVARANPEFAWFYFVHEHFLRYTTKIHRRYEPFWFFLPILMVGLLPWTVFLPTAVRRARAAQGEEREVTDFLLLWAGLIFIFFSFSGSKLVPYILPTVPPLALLLGRAFAVGSEVGESRSAFPWKLPAVLIGASALFLTLLGAALPRFDREMSIREIAFDLRSRLRPGDIVVTFQDYYQGLPFYLGQTITVVAWQQSELSFGAGLEDTSAWMIDETRFRQLWISGQRVYLVGDERFEPPVASGAVSLVARSGRNLLLVNHPLRSSP
jgi:4-amino-4-deoxy-L-arabinose transferase-like glycosyltransferase